MTPKERVLCAIRHEEPDRVPVGEWQYGPEIGGPVLGDACLWLGGMSRARALWEGRRDEVVHQWKTGLVRLAEAYRWDAVLVHLVIGKDTPIEVPEQTDEDKWRLSDGSVLTYSEETDRLFLTERGTRAGAPPPVSPEDAPVDPTPSESELEVVRHVVGELGGTHFVFSAALGGHPQLRYSDASVSEVEQWVKLYEDPDAFLERHLQYVANPVVEQNIERTRREGLDGLAYGWDFGCTTGPFMSPELFRKSILPYLAAYCELVHKHGLLFMLHSCGNNQLLMDSIVAAGVDIYQSIQTEMDIVKMKKRYGGNITLWGGVPAGELVTGTPASVRAEAEPVLRACKPGGGYIYGTSHSIMPGAKYENYLAMLEAHREFGSHERPPDDA